MKRFSPRHRRCDFLDVGAWEFLKTWAGGGVRLGRSGESGRSGKVKWGSPGDPAEAVRSRTCDGSSEKDTARPPRCRARGQDPGRAGGAPGGGSSRARARPKPSGELEALTGAGTRARAGSDCSPPPAPEN